MNVNACKTFDLHMQFSNARETVPIFLCTLLYSLWF